MISLPTDSSPTNMRRLMSIPERSLCSCAANGGPEPAGGGSESLPGNYTATTHQPEKGKAPLMTTCRVAGADGGPRTWILVFGKGDEVLSGLMEFVGNEKITGGQIAAIGAMSSALFGWFDKSRRAYLNIPIDEQVECVSLNGDIGIAEGKPALHVHGAVARHDGTVHGGHLLSAIVWPTLEVFVAETAITLNKKKDFETTLELFDLPR